MQEESKLPYKNLLNEHCQKHRLTIKYNTVRAGGFDHLPLFQSTVDIGHSQAIGTILPSKVSAEQSAAQILWQQLQATLPPLPSIVPNFVKSSPEKVKSDETENILVIVDLENQQKYVKAMEDFNNVKSSNVKFLVIYSKLCTPKISPTISSLVIESAHRDSSDIGIIVLITQHILSGNYKKINCITRDHFGHALSDVVKQLFPDVDYKCHVSFLDFNKDF